MAALAAACNPAATRSPAELSDAEPPPPPQTLSRFNVPIAYDFTPIMTTVERIVPKKFGSLSEIKQIGDDTRRHYAFEATRSPFTAFVVGSQVHLRTTLTYAARGYYKPPLGVTVNAGCGSGAVRPRLVVELVTPLTIDSTWHLKSRSSLSRVERASAEDRDQCKVSILRFDVTDKVVDAARNGLEAQLPKIDKRIATVSLKDHATGWWAALNQPIRLHDALWLKMRPARLRLGKITGAKQLLTIQAGVDAYPSIVTGDMPVVVSSPLPKLAGAPGNDGFDIVIDGNIDYATISKTLTGLLGGKTITTQGKTVAIESVAASGRTGGRIELTVKFSGDAKGSLLLAGTPTYERELGQILVPDLDYDLDTDNRMINTVAWVKSDDLRTMLRDKARIPVGPVLDRGKDLLTAGLNRKIGTSLAMTATVDSVAVQDLYVRRPGIIVRAAAMGKAKVAVMKPASRKAEK